MYGCGLRISECLSLRVHNFNFDMGILTIHDGKGKKDRTVPIPEVFVDELKEQLARVIDLHERNCEAGYGGVFLYGLLEKKYNNAARELIWQQGLRPFFVGSEWKRGRLSWRNHSNCFLNSVNSLRSSFSSSLSRIISFSRFSIRSFPVEVCVSPSSVWE